MNQETPSIQRIREALYAAKVREVENWFLEKVSSNPQSLSEEERADKIYFTMFPAIYTGYNPKMVKTLPVVYRETFEAFWNRLHSRELLSKKLAHNIEFIQNPSPRILNDFLQDITLIERLPAEIINRILESNFAVEYFTSLDKHRSHSKFFEFMQTHEAYYNETKSLLETLWYYIPEGIIRVHYLEVFPLLFNKILYEKCIFYLGNFINKVSTGDQIAQNIWAKYSEKYREIGMKILKTYVEIRRDPVLEQSPFSMSEINDLIDLVKAIYFQTESSEALKLPVEENWDPLRKVEYINSILRNRELLRKLSVVELATLTDVKYSFNFIEDPKSNEECVKSNPDEIKFLFYILRSSRNTPREDASPPSSATPIAPVTAPAIATPTTPVTAPAIATPTTPVTTPAIATPTTPVTAPASATPTTPVTAPVVATPTTPVTAPASATPTTPVTAPASATLTTPVTAPATPVGVAPTNTTVPNVTSTTPMSGAQPSGGTAWPTPHPIRVPSGGTTWPTPHPIRVPSGGTTWPTPHPIRVPSGGTTWPTPHSTNAPISGGTAWPTPHSTNAPISGGTAWPTPHPTRVPSGGTAWPTPHPTRVPSGDTAWPIPSVLPSRTNTDRKKEKKTVRFALTNRDNFEKLKEELHKELRASGYTTFDFLDILLNGVNPSDVFENAYNREEVCDLMSQTLAALVNVKEELKLEKQKRATSGFQVTATNEQPRPRNSRSQGFSELQPGPRNHTPFNSFHRNQTSFDSPHLTTSGTHEHYREDKFTDSSSHHVSESYRNPTKAEGLKKEIQQSEEKIHYYETKKDLNKNQKESVKNILVAYRGRLKSLRAELEGLRI